MSEHASSARDAFFRAQQAAIRAFYLADPGNPYRQSGRSRGAARWEETRRPLADAVDRSGAFLDVGCANGLLLETLRGWCAERGIAIEPHGVDFVPELVDLARRRHPDDAGSFHVANAWDWVPPRRYDVARTSLEMVPPSDREIFIRRQLAWLSPGGRLIVCYYRDVGAPAVDVGATLRSWGLTVVGELHQPVDVAWTDR